mmetsp:Transcript_27854/g.80217  ORF Transcript_27854/g.80217 Transcript_27854/m.80217 type:complete len:102 (-) Transcript_27854:80-385(-)
MHAIGTKIGHRATTPHHTTRHDTTQPASVMMVLCCCLTRNCSREENALAHMLKAPSLPPSQYTHKEDRREALSALVRTCARQVRRTNGNHCTYSHTPHSTA